MSFKLLFNIHKNIGTIDVLLMFYLYCFCIRLYNYIIGYGFVTIKII